MTGPSNFRIIEGKEVEVEAVPPVYIIEGSPERPEVRLETLPSLLPRTCTRISSMTKPAKISVKSVTLGTPGFEQRMSLLPVARKRFRNAATVVGLTISQRIRTKSLNVQLVSVGKGGERTSPCA